MSRLYWIEPHRGNWITEKEGASSGPKVAIRAHRDGEEYSILVQEVLHDLVALYALAGGTSPFLDFLQHVATGDG